MRTTCEPTGASLFQPAAAKPLPEQIADALHSESVPISRLLRLMWALDGESPADEALRAQLRARIGAPRAM